MDHNRGYHANMNGFITKQKKLKLNRTDKQTAANELNDHFIICSIDLLALFK